jgi:D-alanyl-D-alanine carboxypeptidase
VGTGRSSAGWAVLMLAVVLGCSPGSAGASQADRRDAALDRALQELVRMPGGPPGVVAAVQRGGEFRLHRAGVSELGTANPIGRRDHVRIASVAKAFSGYVALRLVSKGVLSLNDTVGGLVRGTPAAWAPVTLRQLLHHTSGIKSFIKDSAFQEYLLSHLTDYISPYFAISFVFDDPLLFPPGTAYGYSNTDNNLIGLMVEAATGRPYPRALAGLISRPLRLTDTSLPVLELGMPSPYARGYDVTPGDPPEDVTSVISQSSAWASGAIISSPRDMTRFIRAWAGGEFLSRKARRAQLRFIPGDGEPPGPGENEVGLGIFRYRTGCGRFFGHSGNTPGYTNWVGATRNGRRSVAVTATTQLTPTTGAPGVFDALREAERLATCAAGAPKPSRGR